MLTVILAVGSGIFVFLFTAGILICLLQFGAMLERIAHALETIAASLSDGECDDPNCECHTRYEPAGEDSEEFDLGPDFDQWRN